MGLLAGVLHVPVFAPELELFAKQAGLELGVGGVGAASSRKRAPLLRRHRKVDAQFAKLRQGAGRVAQSVKSVEKFSDFFEAV